MFALMIIIFIIGYSMIALEHPLRIDKAATALLVGALVWVVYIFGSESILSDENIIASVKENLDNFYNTVEYKDFAEQYRQNNGEEPALALKLAQFIGHHELMHHLSEIAQILFFLLAAMTIVEIVDQHQGFIVITDKIKTTNKLKLLWIIGILTFFMSSVLDNLTTTIVIIALLRKLINDKETRWFFASIVVLAANAGGAFSPIGDVTTIMLWIGGQITAVNIIKMVFLPSILSILLPLTVLSFFLKGEVVRPKAVENENSIVSKRQQILMLVLGVGALLFVPIFKTVTHLPPYLGMLLGLAVIWMVTEFLHRWHDAKKIVSSTAKVSSENTVQDFKRLEVSKIISRVDVPTVLFFLGILSAVAGLQSAGQLSLLAELLEENLGNIYLINIAIGLLSSVIDNVPLVAGAMGMYEIMPAGSTGFDAYFVVDGQFWEFLAYCAGTGGSILIIGSAAGVAAMGLEKIDFIWYFKKISWLALLGYLAGALAYYLQAVFIF